MVGLSGEAGAEAEGPGQGELGSVEGSHDVASAAPLVMAWVESPTKTSWALKTCSTTGLELRPDRVGSVLHCPPGAPPLRCAVSRALEHLSWDARQDVLPQYLRTCQGHSHGCRRHARHRGCSGPVLLVLIREDGGRLWRLADACAAYAAATANAAVVPDTALTPTKPAKRDGLGHGEAAGGRRRGVSRGLSVVDAMAHSWGVTRQRTGHSVWAPLPLRDLTPPAPSWCPGDGPAFGERDQQARTDVRMSLYRA